MKIKSDYVTNSSSTAFIITNISNRDLTLVDFVKENPQLIKEYVKRYNDDTAIYNQKNMIKSAKANNEKFEAGEATYVVFGDEDYTLIGGVFDYILRGGGRSKNFSWRFKEYLR